MHATWRQTHSAPVSSSPSPSPSASPPPSPLSASSSSSRHSSSAEALTNPSTASFFLLRGAISARVLLSSYPETGLWLGRIRRCASSRLGPFRCRTNPDSKLRQGINDQYRFLQVDMFWALCMAINVYFALFRNWTASRMQAVEKWYLLACYRIALIPSIIYLFLKNPKRGKVYGPAEVNTIFPLIF